MENPSNHTHSGLERSQDMEWELSKENVQPLREGRNVEKLNATLKARLEGPTKTMISEQHRKMVEAIDEYEGEDPLQPWIECIKWVKEAYPSGGSLSGLLQLLELCVRTFYKDRRYSNDTRYLKVWMEYADRCMNPQEIFLFLQDNNIGQDHAIFYEHCARYWEQQYKFPKANDMYQLGIARKAEPHDSLKIAYTGFLKRTLRESTLEDQAISPTTLELSGRGFGNVVAGKARGQFCQPISNQKNSKIDRKSLQGFSVFKDTGSRVKQSNLPQTGINFTTESERNKENIQHATRWIGQGLKIPQKSPEIFVPDIEIEVFTDEEFVGGTSALDQRRLKRTTPLASRLLRLDDARELKREADRLREHPLAHFKDSYEFVHSDWI